MQLTTQDPAGARCPCHSDVVSGLEVHRSLLPPGQEQVPTASRAHIRKPGVEGDGTVRRAVQVPGSLGQRMPAPARRVRKRGAWCLTRQPKPMTRKPTREPLHQCSLESNHPDGSDSSTQAQWEWGFTKKQEALPHRVKSPCFLDTVKWAPQPCPCTETRACPQHQSGLTPPLHSPALSAMQPPAPAPSSPTSSFLAL